MRPFPPTLTRRSAVALVAVLGATGTTAYLFLRSDAAIRSCAHPGTGSGDTFQICGDLHRPLVPGTSQPIDMRITNPTRHRLRITRITVSLTLDAAHARAGCDRGRNFRVTDLEPAQYPIDVPPRSTRSLRALGVQPLPRVRLIGRRADQDACKGARLHMRYEGRARRRIGWP